MDGIKIRKHRDGTETRYHLTRLDLAEVARRFAIWTRLVPIGTQTADGIEYSIEREARGRMRDCYGRQAYTTRLRVRAAGREAVATKTKLGEYFGAYLLRLDEDGVEFWEDESRPNRWVLADVFAI